MKPLYLLLSLLLIYSCNNPEEGRSAPADSVNAKRERINQDSTGARKPKDTSGIKFSIGSRLKTETLEVIEHTYTELALQGNTFFTYRRNGKWSIQQPDSSMEILYKWWQASDSMRWRPFVVITENDTLHFYHGDTIRVGPDHNFQQISYPIKP